MANFENITFQYLNSAFKFCIYIVAAEVRLLSQLRESDLPVGDASRTLELKQWPTWAAAHIPTPADYMGSNGSKVEFNSPLKTELSQYVVSMTYA